MDSWPNRKTWYKCSSFEFNHVFTITSTTFTMNDKRINVWITFWKLLSFYNLVLNFLLVIFRRSIEEHTLSNFCNWSNTRNISCFSFSNNTWELIHSVHHRVMESTMITNNSTCSIFIIIGFPVVTQILFVTYFWILVTNPHATNSSTYNSRSKPEVSHY